MALLATAVVLLAVSIAYGANRLCAMLRPWTELNGLRFKIFQTKDEAASRLESMFNAAPPEREGLSEEQFEERLHFIERRAEDLRERVKRAREDLNDLK